MKVGVYGPASLGALGFLPQAFESLGHRLYWREDRGAYKPNYTEDFDLVITDGLRPPMDLMRDEYRAKGIPVIVTDLGYVRRDLGYMQVGIDRLNWLPDFECPADRWDALGVELQPRKHGDYILITGQKPGDGSHGMSDTQLWKLYAGWVEEIRQHTDREIVFRPHPFARDMGLEGVLIDKPSDKKSGGLAEAIEGAHCVVTYNSTSGTDALIAGVPVFCHESAQYADLGNSDFAVIEEPYFPDDRLTHFHKVGYSQWQVQEFTRTVEWLIQRVLNCPS